MKRSVAFPSQAAASSMVNNRIINWFTTWPDIFKFLALVAVTLGITYFSASPVRIIWYVILLIFYYFSKNEALWLAFFLCTTDGFAGFFGLYAVMLPVLPGLPAVELSQLYVLLTVIKAARSKSHDLIFYNKYIQILFVYLIFMIVWGQLMGFTGTLNVYFRVLKGFIPMLLFYSVPRLFTDQDVYYRFFRIIFIIVVVAFAAQIFTLLAGVTPLEAAGLNIEVTEEDLKEFRVFFNASSTLIGLMGALYYLNRRETKPSYRILLYTVVFAALAMAVLSATRGWIISFSLIVLLTFLFTGIVRTRRIVEFAIIAVPFLYWTLSNPTINNQINFARERLGAMEAITQGDLTAQGTLQRLDIRSQRVMDAWKENPLFGWGLSDMGYEYGDGHVGNQCLLAMSGIVGFILLNGFLLFFSWKILSVYNRSVQKINDRNSLLVFLIFLAGWFLIHSTSGQQFNYIGMPAKIIPQAVFFSFGAFQYKRSLSLIYGKKV
jgi:hypothetical protein